MRLVTEIEPREFDYWSGGKARAEMLTDDDWDIVEPLLEDVLGEDTTTTQLNDFMWFEFDTIAKWLGYDSEEHMTLVREGKSFGDSDDAKSSALKDDYVPESYEGWLDDWLYYNWEDIKCKKKEEALSIIGKAYREQRDEEIDGNWDGETDSDEALINLLYEDMEGTIDEFREFIKDKNLADYTARELLEQFNAREL